MIVPPGRRVRLIRWRTPAAEGLAAALSCEGWPARAEVLKQDERSSVLAGDSPAGPVVVKSLRLDRPADGIKRLAGATRLLRQWRGAEMLARHGFAVARPIALWRGRDERGRVVESLAMERLIGRTALQHMADRDPAGEQEFALARALGEQVARLAMLGLVNRDHKPSNLVVMEPQGHRDTEIEIDGLEKDPRALRGAPRIDIQKDPSLRLRASVVSPRIAIIDTVAIRRATPRRALTHMLFELIVEPIGCGVEAPTALRLATVRAAARAMGLPGGEVSRLWREVRSRLARHGDPTPRGNPLG